jgi:HD-GYP domain-containing protein (c-di-GMP phosphodiesterase class II)
VLDGLDTIQAWDEVIALDPRLGRGLADQQLDRALEAFGDFADLKSPTRTGHSRGVAELASAAGTSLGIAADDVHTLRRAALLHDIGVIGVPSSVWNDPRHWSLTQRERARMHPYLTERMLTRVPGLAEVSRCAAQHHERLDGSGYPHGTTGDQLPVTSRLLATADVYHALREPRPHRAALSADAAATVLRDEAREGRLDGEAVNAVLAAAGHRVRRRAQLPAGLTPREAEVLVELARGRSNPDIAAALSISRKTVSSHLEHVYAKAGVRTRAEAALFAMRSGLVGPLPEG